MAFLKQKLWHLFKKTMSPNQSFDKLGATYFEIWQTDSFKNYHAFIYEPHYFQKFGGFRQNLDLMDIWAI